MLGHTDERFKGAAMKIYIREYDNGKVSTRDNPSFTDWGKADDATDYEADTATGTVKLIKPKDGWHGDEYYVNGVWKGLVRTPASFEHVWGGDAIVYLGGFHHFVCQGGRKDAMKLVELFAKES